jgi:hypothetical protein
MGRTYKSRYTDVTDIDRYENEAVALDLGKANIRALSYYGVPI